MCILHVSLFATGMVYNWDERWITYRVQLKPTQLRMVHSLPKDPRPPPRSLRLRDTVDGDHTDRNSAEVTVVGAHTDHKSDETTAEVVMVRELRISSRASAA